jgi:long-chain fatty acid transport protein
MESKRRAPWARCSVVLLAAAWCAASALVSAPPARAAGVEDTVGGTIAVGRAANYVRAHDFMAIWQNPANLAVVPGRDLGLELRLPVFNACFDRARDPDVEYKPEESFAKVCNDSKLFPSGNGGFVMSFDNGLGFGAGVFTPSGIARVSFGDDRIVTFGQDFFPNEQYPLTTSGAESANRYILLERTVIPVFLMAGLGYEIVPQFRLGLSAGFGIISIHFKNVASLTGRTFVDQEVLNDVHVNDWFVPRLTASAIYQPRNGLEFLAQVTVTADISADGYVDVTANGIQGAPRGNCKNADPGPHCRVEDVTLDVPYQRAEVYLGARYAALRPGHMQSTKMEPMVDELWDVEANVYWANTGHVDAYRLTLYDVPPSDPNAGRVDFTSDPAGSPSPLPPNAVIPHRWKDTWGFRVGGDYNVMPSLLSVRAGFSYESSAIRRSYMNLDYFPTQRIGLHVGATLALGMVSLHIAYAHIFYDQVKVPVGAGRLPEIVALDRAAAQPVNEGSFNARADWISLQGNLRF